MPARNSIRVKRCLRVRETQHFEATQQALSVRGSSYRSSTIRSSISGGRGDDIAVSRQIQLSGSTERPLSVSSTMTSSTGSGEIYPGESLSVSQLLYAVKKKLQDTSFGGRFVQTSQNPRDVTELAHNRCLTGLRRRRTKLR